MAAGQPIYALRGVSKARHGAGTSFELSVPHLLIHRGEVLVIRGASGCGKSTLLDLLATTLRPDAAERFTFAPDDGVEADLAALWRNGDSDGLTLLRGAHIGYVLQTGGLLPFLTVRENIALPGRLLGRRVDQSVDTLAERLGIARYLDNRPDTLSVGERQRVAIARALAHRPAVVLADEPTASVDPIAADTIFGVFVDTVERLGITAVIVSHDWDRIADAGLQVIEHRLESGDSVNRSYFWN